MTPSKKTTRTKADPPSIQDPFEKYKKIEEYNEKLQADIKKLLGEREVWDNEKPRLQKDLGEAQDEIRKLRERVTQLENENKKLANEKERFSADLQRLNKKPKENNEEINKPSIDDSSLVYTLSTLTQVAKQIHEQLEPIKADLVRIQFLEKELRIENDRNRRYERDKNRLKFALSRSESQLHKTKNILGETQQELDQVQQEKDEFQKSIQAGNQVVESLQEQLTELREQLSQEKHQVGVEWAQELAPILTKLSSLAEMEPESEINLKPRSIYEMFLDWMEKIFGERPKPFPSKRKLQGEDTNNPEIFLDVDRDSFENLLKLYDWSPDRPFEGLQEGNRKRKFRILHWGWKVNEHILVKARLSPLPVINTGESKLEESHGI